MCNCTVCSRKRGEEYIPQSRARIPYIIPEYLPTPTSQPLPKPASPPPNTSNDPKPSNSLLGRSVSTMQQRKSSATNPSFDLPERAFWGTIYGPDGNPVGKGFMGDGNQQIIIQNGETEPPSLPLEPLPKLRSRTRRKTKSSLEFIGQLRDRWCTKPPRPSPSTDPSTTAPEVPAGSRTYIGRRVSLFDKSYKSLDDHSFSATMSMQQRTSPSSDPSCSHGPQTGNLFDESSPTASFGGNKASDPPGQISEDIMGFLLAEILKPADPLDQNT